MKRLNCHFLFSDTESLLYEVKLTDSLAELANNLELRKHFDTSIYPKDHKIRGTENKLVTLKFKNEPLAHRLGIHRIKTRNLFPSNQ